MAASEIAKCVFSIDSQKAVSALNVFNGQLSNTTAFADTAKAAIGAIFSGSIIAGSKYFIDLASDAQETTQKFGVVFQSVSVQANAAVKKLVNTYNMSTHAARTALSDTGDLLSGFGFTGSAALDLAEKINQLGSDLASFTNYEGGAKGAAEALTKALLGEREQAKMLGIAITEEQVKAQMDADKKAGLTYQTLAHAKAYATYKIAVSQSVNAIGDAERSTESYAYNARRLANNLEDLKRNIGAALIEPATKISSGLAKCVSWLNNLNPALVKYGTIATVAAGFIGGLSVATFKVYNAISTFCIMSKLGSAATQYNTQQTAGNTATQATNATAINSSIISRNASTQAIAAQTAALSQNTAAARMNAVANSGTQNNYTSQSISKAQEIYKNSVMKSYAQAANTGKQVAPVPGAFNKLIKTQQTALAHSQKLELRNVQGVRATGAFSKLNSASELLQLKTWLPGYKALGKNVGGIFGKIPALITKPLLLVTGLFGKSKLLATITSFGARFAGYAVPFVGWGTAIVTGVGLVFSAFKRMPEWLEIFIQEFWPKIKTGSVFVIKKVGEFLSPSNLWNLLKNGIFGFGKLLSAGWNGVVNVTKRLAGYETEAQKAYTSNKITKSLEESKRWTNELADAEKKLIEQRKLNIEATKKTAKGMAVELYGVFDTTNESKQKARQKVIENEEKTLNEMGVDSDAKKDLIGKRNLFMGSYKNDESEMKKLQNQLSNTEVGSGKFNALEEKRKVLQRSMDFNKQQVTEIDTQLKAFNIDPKKYTDQFEKILKLKTENAIETAKENKEFNNDNSETAFGLSLLGKKGTEKTNVLGNRVTELEAKEKSDLEAYYKQEKARKRLNEIATNENDPINADLAKAAVTGDKDAIKKLADYDSIFKDLAPMLTKNDLLKNAENLQSAKEDYKSSQEEDRANRNRLQYNADQKRINISSGKLQEEEDKYGLVKERALKMHPSAFKSATDEYIKILNQSNINEIEALNHKISNIKTEMAATTDQKKLADLEADKIELENDVSNKQRDHNKKIKETYKERDKIERERSERQKALKQNIQKSLDDSLLKEAKTGKQRLAIYGGQYQRAMMEYRSAQNDEKKYEALGKVKEASDSINGEIDAMAQKQAERNKNIWNTAGPQKAITAGSVEASSIQNKLYNTHQRNIEKNTKDMLGLNKRMVAELQTMNSKQTSDYTLDVKA